jgi:hypothetical protein
VWLVETPVRIRPEAFTFFLYFLFFVYAGLLGVKIGLTKPDPFYCLSNESTFNTVLVVQQLD